jgi:hypothetical protein
MGIINAFSTQTLTFGLLSAFFVVFILLIWIIILQKRLGVLHQRNTELFSGKKISSLEDLIIAQSKNLKTLDKDIQELYEISNQINNLAFRGIHKTAMLRFNPFKEVGGDQSFAIALLNGRNSGIVISSLYTREGTRVYSKNIVNGKAEKYPLTEEELKAIEMALISEPKKL